MTIKFKKIMMIFLVSGMVAASNQVSYASATSKMGIVAATNQREMVVSVYWALEFWDKVIGAVKDLFSGPEVTEREEISEIKEFDPYDSLDDVSYTNESGMKELKAVSAGFYQLIRTLSTLGLILALISGGLSIAWCRNKKLDLETSILSKVLVFMVICAIADIYAIFVPLIKMLTK